MQKQLNGLLLPLLCVALLCQARTTSGQALDAPFRSDVETLLAVTGSAELGRQAMSIFSAQLLSGLKQSQPDIPDRALEIAKQVFDSEFAKAFAGPDSLADQVVFVYARHFTHEDIRGLLAFYSTELGKKMITSMPLVLQEGAAAGQQWAEKQMPQVLTVLQSRLRAEGFIK